MDISDILTSISHPTTAANLTSASHSNSRNNNSSKPHPRALDQQALTRAWINERVAPELLPYPTALVERCTRAVAGQIEVLEGMASGGYQDDGGGGGGGGGGVFGMVVLQTELERFRFLLRGFLRARIAKVSFPPFFSSFLFFSFGRVRMIRNGREGEEEAEEQEEEEEEEEEEKEEDEGEEG
jgi:GINS complex subunit 4